MQRLEAHVFPDRISQVIRSRADMRIQSFPGDAVSPVNWFCAAGFLLLFPGFFLYQTVIGLGLIPAFLGGFYRLMALAVVTVSIVYILYAKPLRLYQLNKASRAFLWLLAWIAIVTVLHYFVGAQAQNMELLEFNLSAIVINTAGFAIALGLPLASKLFKCGIILSLIAMVVITMILAENGVFYLRAQGLGDEEKTATYQGFARSLAVTGIIAVAIVRSGLLRIGIATAAVIALYLNVARSELVCFVLALLALWGAYSIWCRRRIAPLAAFVVCAMLLPFLSLDAVQTKLPQNRILQLLDLAGASSAIERVRFSEAGWEEIVKHPFGGNYGFYYDTEGIGGYPHSILAAWVNFGVIGISMFLLVALLLSATQMHLVKCGFLESDELKAAITCLAFTLIAVLFAKEYSYIFIGMSVGLTQQAWNSARNETYA